MSVTSRSTAASWNPPAGVGWNAGTGCPSGSGTPARDRGVWCGGATVNSRVPPTRSAPSASSARTRRYPAPTPPSAPATRPSGPPGSSITTARASGARIGRIVPSPRSSDAASQPHPKRGAGPARPSSGSVAAASAPSTSEVAWYANESDSVVQRIGGCVSTRRMRGSARSRRSDRGRPVPPDRPSPVRSTTFAVASARSRRSSPKRACTGPPCSACTRWMNPRTSRHPSSNRSHGFRSRHWWPPGNRTCPLEIRSAATLPG